MKLSSLKTGFSEFLDNDRQASAGIRQAVGNSLLVTLALLAIPITIASLSRHNPSDWTTAHYIHLALLGLVLFATWFRQRLPVRVVSGIIIVCILTGSIFGAIQFGLMGASFIFLSILPALILVFYGAMAGIWSLLGIIGFTGLVAVLYSNGTLTYAFDISEYAKLPGTWLTRFFAVAMVGSFAFFGANAAISYLKKIRDDLADKAQALETTNKNLSEAQSIAQIGSWNREVSENTLYWSDELYRIFGLDPEADEITLEKFLDMIHPDDRQMMQDLALRSRETNLPFQAEHRIIRPDGTIRWIEERGRTTVDRSGKPIRFSGTGQDITEIKLARIALSESETRFAAIIDSVAVPTIITRKSDGKILFANRISAEIDGQPSDEMIGRDTRDSWADPAERERFLALLERDGRIDSFEFSPVPLDGGEPRYFVISARKIYYEGEKAILSSYVDVSERKNAENEIVRHRERLAAEIEDQTKDLVASEERLQDLLDGSLQGIVVFCNDRLVFCNDVYADLHGYSKEEILRLPSLESLLAPSESKRLMAFPERRLAGKPVPEQYEYQARKKDGSLFWAANRARVVTWDGEPAIQSTLVNITERKKAEQMLAESERRFRQMLESSPIGVGISRISDGQIEYLNSRAMELNGMSREDMFSSVALDFWADLKDRETFISAFRRDGKASGEVQLKRKDGSLFWSVLTWESAPLFGEKILFWVYDISELKEVQERLVYARDIAENASNSKSEFLSSMSHELRTPLNSVLGFSQLLKEDPEQPLSEDQTESVDHIWQAGRHLLNLIDEVLDLSKIESGTLKVAMEDVNLSHLVHECIDLTKAQADNAGISIEVSSLPDVLVRADNTRLKQIVLNLISNAIKYNKPNGQVRLSATIDDDSMASISVADTGRGISSEHFEELFQPFSRLGYETSTIEGTGVGLTITRKLIEAMDGSIEVESEIGEGSTFTIRIPAASSVG